MSSEAYAILRALKRIRKSTRDKFVILNVSKGVVSAIRNPETGNIRVQRIVEQTEILTGDLERVLYSYTPCALAS